MNSETDTPRTPQLDAPVLSAIAPYLVAIALLIAIAAVSVDILSAVRAFVAGESLWSKAQKEAVQALYRYAATGNAAFLDIYRREIAVPLGDRRARMELEQPQPREDVVREGFGAGRNDPDDIAAMARLFRRFRHAGFMEDAIATWTKGDAEIAGMIAAAEQLQQALAGGGPKSAIDDALERLHLADERLTPLEQAFSATLGDASRRIGQFLQLCSLVLALALVAIAAWFWRYLLRRNMAVERALRASEERLDLAVSSSSEGIWNWSSGDADVYLSPRATELLGFPEGRAPRRPEAMLALVHTDQREMVADAVRALLLAQTTLDVEFRFRDYSGAFRWAHVRGRALRNDIGGTLRVAGSIADISDRKRVEERRREIAVEARRRAEQAQIAFLEQVQGRVGRELHDDLGQQLTGVAFLAKALEQRLSEASPAERDQTSWIVKLINEAIDRVRFMSRQLSPMALDELTLGSALERLVADVHGIFGTRISLHMSDDETRISGANASQFFRIAQESITNALRHGQATRIDVHLHARGAGARLAVCDNGHGFAVRGVDPNASLGLRSMAIRAESLSGRLRIRSGRRGTVLVVRSASCGYALSGRSA